jgi:hypothetical protein
MNTRSGPLPLEIRAADRLSNTESVAPPRPAKLLKLRRDLQVLTTFVTLYCDGRHPDAKRTPLKLPRLPVSIGAADPPALCAECGQLLAHALVKRVQCRYDPKPTCKKCTTHCYGPMYRAQIRAAMKYSGRRLVLAGRLDYLWHLLF